MLKYPDLDSGSSLFGIAFSSEDGSYSGVMGEDDCFRNYSLTNCKLTLKLYTDSELQIMRKTLLLNVQIRGAIPIR